MSGSLVSPVYGHRVYADFYFVLQKDRYKALNTLAKELVQGNYYQKDAVQKK